MSKLSKNEAVARPSPAPKDVSKQTHADFWREQRASGLTPSLARARLNSLPRIVPIPSATKPPTK